MMCCACALVSDRTLSSGEFFLWSAESTLCLTWFRDSDFEDLATGLLLSLGPTCGTLFRPKLDNRVTIYYSSRVNWKHFCSSSPEPFCGSISNKGPYKYSILLLLLLLFSPGWTWTNCSSIHQKLNSFLLAQNSNVSNFLILQIFSAMIRSLSVPLLTILASSLTLTCQRWSHQLCI